MEAIDGDFTWYDVPVSGTEAQREKLLAVASPRSSSGCLVDVPRLVIRARRHRVDQKGGSDGSTEEAGDPKGRRPIHFLDQKSLSFSQFFCYNIENDNHIFR